MKNTDTQLYDLCSTMAQVIQDLCREVERNTCSHEETHRGGSIWEICDQCGAKWADDEGGKPDYVEPGPITKAVAILDEWKNFNKYIPFGCIPPESEESEVVVTVKKEKDPDSLYKALKYVIEDLEIRSNWKPSDQKGVVDIGHGAYIQAKNALESWEK